jgi:uncharacterized membrane protein YfcA
MPLFALVTIFLLIALVYSSVGFGGGSSYNAILVLSGTSYLAIPAISLTCNIAVVCGGVFHFYRAGHLDAKALLPFVVLSVPLAWLGGRVPIEESTFIGLLGMALLLSGLQMLRSSSHRSAKLAQWPLHPWKVLMPVSGLIGLLFLAPLLHLSSWGEPRRIAAIASGFILFNSIAGLSGQLMKQGDNAPLPEWISAWPLFIAVIIGGQIGSRLGARVVPEIWIKRLTAALVLYVAIRLIVEWVMISVV